MPDNNERMEDIARMAEKARWLANTWLAIKGLIPPPDKEAFELNPAITRKVAFHYAKDLRVLKKRYQICDMVQPPKIAGLLANAILKYRPLIPFYGLQPGIENSTPNEFLAIYCGVCVCANCGAPDQGNKIMAALMDTPHFRLWFKRFLFLLRDRNYTSESLIMVFETLCLFAFPAALDETN
jgi:hypothetical protein